MRRTTAHHDDSDGPVVPPAAELIRHFCLPGDLSTSDPYDRWCTPAGLRLKSFYFRHPRVGLLPAAVFGLIDDLLGGLLPPPCRREYPIVRAFAALCLMNLYRQQEDGELLPAVRRHLDWLLAHQCRGWSGPCWGLGFPNVISGALRYDGGIPYSTMTPYALEAFVCYTRLSGLATYLPAIRGIFRFFAEDLQVMAAGDGGGGYLATSYTPLRDRVVVNAVSYNMYAHALCLPFLPAATQPAAADRALKLYRFVRRSQRPDGSWLYSPDGNSFIDCFHSCIVLKNIIKTARLLGLDGAGEVVASGYGFLIGTLYDRRRGLFGRFALKNKPGLVHFDLYDNAEMLNLAELMGDLPLARQLRHAIFRHFYRAPDIYSQIDCFGILRRKNSLRWAVMPLLYALSTGIGAENSAGRQPACMAAAV